MTTRKTYEKKIRIHFGDCDPAGIVYHPQYYVILNQLMEDFMQEAAEVGFIEIRKYGVGFPVVGIRTDFSAPSRPGDVCVGRVWMEHLGASSMRFAFTITSLEGEMRLKCLETSVCVKSGPDGRFVKEPIPARVREALAPYVNGPEDELLELRS